MDERGPDEPLRARRRALVGGALGLALIAISGAYLVLFDAGAESIIAFGLVFIVGALFVVLALRYWQRTSP